MSKWLALGSVGFVALACAVLALRPTTHVGPVANPSPRPDRAAIPRRAVVDAGTRRVIHGLRDELDALREQQRDLQERLAETHPGPSLASEETGAAPHATAVEPDAQRQLEALDRLVDREIVDGSWAHDAETSLRTALSSDEFEGMDVADVRCASTACRIEFAFDGGQTEENGNTLKRAMFDLPWSSPGFFHLPGDQPIALMYVAREGHDLPRAEGSGPG